MFYNNKNYFICFIFFSVLLLISFSCSNNTVIKRRHLKKDEEVGDLVNNIKVPKLDIIKTDTGLLINWDWIDYFDKVYSVHFSVSNQDIQKGKHNRLYEIRALPYSPSEIDYGSLIRSGGIKFMDDLALQLKKIGIDNGYDFRRLADVIVSMIQNIPYTLIHQLSHHDILKLAEKEHIDFLISYHNDPNNSPFSRKWYGGCRDSVEPAGVYSPAEFISTMQGDCDTRTLFLYALMKKIGYDVVIINGPGHSMLGSNLRPENPAAPFIECNGLRYYFWETTFFYYQNNKSGPRLGDILVDNFNTSEWKIMLK